MGCDDLSTEILSYDTSCRFYQLVRNENARTVCELLTSRFTFMQELYDYFSGPVTFVHLATLCYVLGLLTRNELRLRAFILIGTCFYILYYYFIAEAPLWEAIATSVLIGSANLPVIWRIFRERSVWGMSEEMLTLYAYFPSFNPGQFRKMIAKGSIIDETKHTVLLKHGERPSKLYLTLSDGFMLSRHSQYAELGPGNFLGEISFVLGGPASATVTAEPGARYVAWDVSTLEKLMETSPRFANAIPVLLSQDIARKLAGSFPSPAPAMPKTIT